MSVDELALYEETAPAHTVLVSDIWLDEATGTEVLDRLSVEGPPFAALMVSWNVVVSPNTPARPDAHPSDFVREKEAFLRLLPDLKRRSPGKFVAVHDEKVVDVDPSSAVLVRRFFERFGETSVYVGYVGGRRIIRNISPRIRRS